MEDRPFTGANLPGLMTPEQALDVARHLKASADELAALGAHDESLVTHRRSRWWLTYAHTIAAIRGKPPESTER